MILRPLSPQYNLALEEAAYRECSLEKLAGRVYVWVNRPSVIVGRSSREGLDYSCSAARKYGVPVYRRFTGGGAVLHDEGVLSITVIGERRGSLREVYRAGTSLIVAVVEGLGGWARVANEADIVVGGCKVSGGAAHLARDRYLYHATLIVDSPLEGVRELTPPRTDRIASGSVDPVKYKPCPLSGSLPGITVEDVVDVMGEVAEAMGRRLAPLIQAAPECGLSSGLLMEYVDRRLRDPHWTPCG